MHVRIVRLERGDYEVTTPARKVVVNEVRIDEARLGEHVTDVELEAQVVLVMTEKRGSVDTTVCVVGTIRSYLDEKLKPLKKLKKVVKRFEDAVDALSAAALLLDVREEERKEKGEGEGARAPQGGEPEHFKMVF
jgi:hypothetical protein